MTPDITPFVERIERAYDELGHELGWRFLNGPAQTLSLDTRLAFVGLNPGGDVFHPPQASVEAGSAYRVERWGPGHALNPLQVQVRRMFDELARKLGAPSSQLMDDTLAWNFCPFRSPDWDRLANRARSLAFSAELGTSVLAVARPRAILCLGDIVDRQLGVVLEAGGLQRTEAQRLPTGWGTISYGLTRYASADGSTLVVRLPHLSRFAIFGRPASRAAVDGLTDAVAGAVAP